MGRGDGGGWGCCVASAAAWPHSGGADGWVAVMVFDAIPVGPAPLLDALAPRLLPELVYHAQAFTGR